MLGVAPLSLFIDFSDELNPFTIDSTHCPLRRGCEVNCGRAQFALLERRCSVTTIRNRQSPKSATAQIQKSQWSRGAFGEAFSCKRATTHQASSIAASSALARAFALERAALCISSSERLSWSLPTATVTMHLIVSSPCVITIEY